MSAPGIVKKLLFPGFTDAGANDTFQPKNGVSPEANMEELTSKSDATTAVLDNRSSALSQAKRALQANHRRQTTPPRRRQTVENRNEFQARTKFFPSTDPHRGSTRNTTSRIGTKLTSPFPTTSPRVKPQETEQTFPLDQSSMTAASGTSGVSSLLGQRFLEDEDEDAENEDNGKAMLGNEFLKGLSSSSRGGTQANDDNSSDVDSTSSEMGTVINATDRLNDVSQMASYVTPKAVIEEENENEDEQEIVENDVDRLSLPMLDDDAPAQREASTDEARASRGDRAFSGGMVSAAFRRIGSIHRSGAHSAPATPRQKPTVEDYLRSAYRSQDETDVPISSRFSPRSTSQGPRTKGISNGNSMFRHANALSSHLRFARGCLSFDSTADSQYTTSKSAGPPSLPTDTRSWDSGGLGLRFRPVSYTKSWDGEIKGGIPLGDRDSSVHDVVGLREFIDHGDSNVKGLAKPETDRENVLTDQSESFTAEAAKKEIVLSRQVIAGSTEDDGVSTFAEVGQQEVHPDSSDQNLSDELAKQGSLITKDLLDAIHSIREISEMQGDVNLPANRSHAARMLAIDQLVSSYEEMKRLASSASAWPKSNGRNNLAPSDSTQSNQKGREKNDNVRSGNENRDLEASQALVKSLEARARDREEQIRRLNEELSNCRAEIGRMKLASRTEV